MICDEGFMSTILDDPVCDQNSSRDPPDAVLHVVSSEENLWSKVIDLDQCNRSSLNSLLTNLEKLLIIRSTPSVGGNLSLPTIIRIRESSLSISYKLSSYGSVLDYQSNLEYDLSERLIAVIISRCLASLNYLHSMNILHRNLSANHLLISKSEKYNGSNDELQISLCGLGSLGQQFSMVHGLNDIPSIHSAWRGWRKACHRLSVNSSYSHPTAWFSPELVTQDFMGYTCATDIYSVGLIIAELFTGRPPFLDAQPPMIAFQKLCYVEPPDFFHDHSKRRPSQPLLDVYKACVQNNPTFRPTAAELLEMPWLKWGLEIPFTRSLLETG